MGAGIAGLTAARDLAAAGIPVQVIEARGRIGGRLWTSREWPDAPVDLGASWIHGTTGNPVTELASQARARLVTTSYDSGVAFDASGRRLGRAGEAAVIEATDDVAAALGRAQDADADRSVLEAIRSGVDYAGLDPARRNVIDFVTVSNYETEYAGSASEQSAFWFDDGKQFPGPDALFPDGYHSIADHLATDVPIATGQVVTEVAWDRSGVQVTTSKGHFAGSQVIVTTPLGVLKSGAISFTPGLPSEVSGAIRALGMGVLNKIALRFDKVFWDADVDWIEYIPDGGEPWVEWISLVRATGKPILLGFAAGALGRRVDGWSDAEVVAKAMSVVRKMHGAAVPPPTGSQITRWGADPFAGGSYSFNALGSSPRMREALAAPIGGRLHFAGEATTREYFGTVHGAHLSGRRAARNVLS